MIDIKIYLNEARGSMIDGFYGTPALLRLAAEFQMEDICESNTMVLNKVYELANIGGDLVPHTEWSKAYRENANRSLSIGDVVTIDGAAYAVAEMGFEKIGRSGVDAAVNRGLRGGVNEDHAERKARHQEWLAKNGVKA